MKHGIYQLTEADRPILVQHLLRLSTDDRRLRFGAALPDEAVSRIAGRLDVTSSFGYFVHGKLVALGLLAPEGEDCAEFAISVDAPLRKGGLAKLLLLHCLELGANQTGTRTVVIRHASENRAMARLCSEVRAVRKTYGAEVESRVDVTCHREAEMAAVGLLCASEA